VGLFGGLLELTVPVYNINKGFNADILGKSETLAGYVFFVDLARKYENTGYEAGDAVRRAVEDCIGQGILADFLRDHSSEVINMLTAEFKLEEALQVWKEEGKEEGKEEMARNLLANGVPLDIIAQSAGMPLEKIQALAG
jgi:hypothetical protein